MHFALESWLVLFSFASKMLACLVICSYIFGSLLYYVREKFTWKHEQGPPSESTALDHCYVGADSTVS